MKIFKHMGILRELYSKNTVYLLPRFYNYNFTYLLYHWLLSSFPILWISKWIAIICALHLSPIMSGVSLSRARYLLTFCLFFEVKLTCSEMHKSSGHHLRSFDKCLYLYGRNLKLSIEHIQPLQVPSCAFPVKSPYPPPEATTVPFLRYRLAGSNQLLTNAFSPIKKKKKLWLDLAAHIGTLPEGWMNNPFSHRSRFLKLFFLLSRWLTYPPPWDSNHLPVPFS